MIISLKSILEIAESKNIAIAAFNVTSLEGIQAALSAAEELNQPVILQFANAAHGRFVPMDVIGPVMVIMAEKASVPVCVHLDHGDSLMEVNKALQLGFSGVMYDGSMLTYEENVANTKAAVELAGKYGASVEAEIGSMGREEFSSAGMDEQTEEIEGCYTDPKQAAAFVAETGIDALACSFGTVHGIYLHAPKLDIERIGKIRKATGIPVVMHGGSGISDSDFRKCIQQGVRKINFYTYAAKDAGTLIKDKIESEQTVFFHDIAVWGRESMKDTYLKTIRVFSDLK